MSDKKVFPLSALTRAISKTIENYCSTPTWVKADIVKLNHYTHSGHCYPDLVEKKNNKIVAEIRGTIWKNDFQRINKKFKEFLNEGLKDDITIVCLGTVNYHPVYGITFHIKDIDPSFTLGELARQKAQTIQRLKNENIFELNKKKALELTPKSIAIISVETSKGYKDFLSVIQGKDNPYSFNLKLFPAILQGERSVMTIITQLNRIKKYVNIFDAVAIIRGGGGEIGLSSYDDYRLAKEIATYPIPVLTGIGHATNETVSEMVSFQSFITPTKIASFLIEQFYQFEKSIHEAFSLISRMTVQVIEEQKHTLKTKSSQFESHSSRLFEKQKSLLQLSAHKVLRLSEQLINHEKQQLQRQASTLHHEGLHTMQEHNQQMELFASKLKLLDPKQTLKRGYSITKLNGKYLNALTQAKVGDTIVTQLVDGTIESTIKEKKTND